MKLFTLWPVLLAQLLVFGEGDSVSKNSSEPEKQKKTVLDGPDLGKLKKDNLQLMAFGDGIIAGWRDGGLFRKGQETAFPNLVASQMGINHFRSPLFEENDSIGTGYLILTPSDSGPRWQKVEAKTDLLNGEPPRLPIYNGEEVHNMGIPKITEGSLSGKMSPKNNGWIYGDTKKGYALSMPFFWRIFPQINPYETSYFDEIMNQFKAKAVDLALISFGYDEWVSNIVKSDHTYFEPAKAGNINKSTVLQLALRAKENGVASIVYTLPDFRHLAYFNWFTYESLSQLKGKAIISILQDNILGKNQVLDNAMFLPTQSVVTMFERVKKGEQFAITLLDSDVIDASEIDGGVPILYNQRIRREAAIYNIPVVDLEALYQKIYEGRYVTADGLLIDGSPRGNFFSADGLYPSAIGNAVIANETIKIINQHYSANIPLINVSLFSKSLK